MPAGSYTRHVTQFGLEYTGTAIDFTSLSPEGGSSGNAQDAALTITLDQASASIETLVVDGKEAVTANVFQLGWTGTITDVGSTTVITKPPNTPNT